VSVRLFAGVLLALLLSGCGGTARPAAAPASASESRPSPSDVPASATAAPTPATSSGPLDADDVPEAGDLGRDWQEYDDPGGAEAGFTGNGSFVRARQPAEVVQSLVPLGCPGVDRVAPVPTPRHVLEATYRTQDGAPAVVLVLAYPDDDTATRAVGQLARLRATCRAPARGEPAQGRTVIDIERSDDQRLWDRSRTVGLDGGWVELVRRVDDKVGVLAMARSEAPAGGFATLDEALAGSLADH
jgi:hypothetical protein